MFLSAFLLYLAWNGFFFSQSNKLLRRGEKKNLMTLGIQINKMDHLCTAAELWNLLKYRESVAFHQQYTASAHYYKILVSTPYILSSWHA